MAWLPSDPVGLPGLVALTIGFALFGYALAMARLRSPKPDAGGRRANASIIWIIVQGLGIGSTGLGAIRIGLAPLSPQSIAAAIVVLALMASAAALFRWSAQTMGKNWSLVARTREDATLITDGPFAYVRNPIYVALALFMVAMAIAYGHIATLIVALPIYALGTWFRVQHEERLLAAEFGDAYAAYAARVKRFVPGVF